jgi:imidazolonepropionase-like amidohydrolase
MAPNTSGAWGTALALTAPRFTRAGLRPRLGAVLLVLSAAGSTPAWAQVSTERQAGLRDNTPRWHAITGARLVLAPGKVIEQGTVVMRDGVITAVGAQVKPPAGARVWHLPGRTVYAGFIDLHSQVGVPASLSADAAQVPPSGDDEDEGDDDLRPRDRKRSLSQRSLSQRSLAASNPLVHPEQDIASQLQWPASAARGLREAGFTAALAAPGSGVFRGQSALVSLAGKGEGASARAAVLQARVAQHLAFEFNGPGKDSYPTSLMGSMALVRQTLLNARWQGAAQAAAGKPGAHTAERPEANASLDALAPVLQGRQRVFFEARDEQDDSRIAALSEEFRLRTVILGQGREYRRLPTLQASRLPVVLPLNYPAAPRIDHPDAELDIPLEALQHWEAAASNPAKVAQAGIPMALSTAGLADPGKEFWPRLRQAVARGLKEDAALAALTTTPAALLGEQPRLGEIGVGRLAHLVVARGNLFTQESAEIELSFIDGQALPAAPSLKPDWRGRWQVSAGQAAGTSGPVLEIKGSREAPQTLLDGKTCPLRTQQSGQLTQWVLRLPCDEKAAAQERWVFSAAAQASGTGGSAAHTPPNELTGTRQTGDGPLAPWSARRLPELATAGKPSDAKPTAGTDDVAKAATAASDTPAAPRYPAGAYGIATPEQPGSLLVRQATVWTQGSAGRLQQADVWVRQGKIAAVGPQLAAPAGTVVIDARGKHLTPGLIDAHSHIAIARGVNEGSDSVTAEVRVGDVLDATDINIYRQLAGGLTAANLLHGSANTIGGQSQVIKLRWGQTAPGLVFEGAAPSNKFALGENVKRSNWGDPSRYPASRMGVEQILRDQFAAAAEYAAQWKAWRAKPEGRPEPRTDLRLQALAEILERKRLVHIHSYRADEILMFARMARELGITVAAFQHVLEGYKVADAMADIGAGASTFADWWAYKMEVMDAIPHNMVMMHRQGVLTSVNSDDADIARRMNIEAAKAMKYGGASAEEALNLVTLFPARQLRVDHRVGSIEVGKDADFVIWSGDPLSPTSRAEQTWIEGRRYFSLETDAQLQKEAQAERQRLLAKVQAEAVASGAGKGSGKGAGQGGAKEGDPAADKAPDLADVALGATTRHAGAESAADIERALNRLLHRQRHHRHSYSEAGSWHECTEDSH